jgi:hypothetical protein
VFREKLDYILAKPSRYLPAAFVSLVILGMIAGALFGLVSGR